MDETPGSSLAAENALLRAEVRELRAEIQRLRAALAEEADRGQAALPGVRLPGARQRLSARIALLRRLAAGEE
ncbi:MAG: hypothetical protein RBU45_10425 [Myxococcota bacterium]|jgi:phosphate uptake regulator|nr:hypothetical protein [Myxococcota bacterium]